MKINDYIKFISDFTEQNEEIIGVFYGGSIARNDSDEYSDIDVRFVVEDAAYQSMLIKRFINFFDTKIFTEESNNLYAILHFENMKKIDAFFFSKEDLLPSKWLENILIAKDNRNILANLKKESQGLLFTVDAIDVKYRVKKYLAHMFEVEKRRVRNEYFYCEYSINQMTNILCSLWYLEQGCVPNAIGDWSKYQGRRSQLSEERKNKVSKIFEMNNIELKVECLNKELFKVISSFREKYDIDLELDVEIITSKYI
jgi:predicted nucleotidyltransferase